MMPETSNATNGENDPLGPDENGNNNLLQNRGNAKAAAQPVSKQGSDEEVEENMSGTTNLTIEQLKKGRNPGDYSAEGAKNNDVDDL